MLTIPLFLQDASSSEEEYSKLSKWYDATTVFFACCTIIALPIVIYVQKIYRNYSSTLMLIALGLMAIDLIILTTLRLVEYFPTELESEQVEYINTIVSMYVFSSIAWLLLLQWY